VKHAANTHLLVAGSPTTNPARKKKLVMDDNGTPVLVDDCVRDLYRFWDRLINQLYPVAPRKSRRPKTIQYKVKASGTFTVTAPSKPTANS
jgi:hypothetical protein